MTITQTPPRAGRNGRPRRSVKAVRRPVVNEPVNVVQIPLALISPHPKNPGRHRITPENTKQLADDLAAHGLQQPIKVRTEADGYEIIFGERRYRAAELLGWPSIAAMVCEASDADALTWQAIENGQREDVDPVSVAQHLAELVEAGLTQADAGRCYGISQGEVANRIRLLRLPRAWLELIAQRDIPAKKARLLVPYADASHMLAALAKEYRASPRERSFWRSGDSELEPHLVHMAQRLTRPMDKSVKHYYGWQEGEHPRYFDADEATLRELQVVELPLGKRAKKGASRAMQQRAQNVALWEKLNKAGVDKAVARREKRRGGDRSKPAAEMTPAEKSKHEAQQRKQRAGQLREGCQQWRMRMLRLCTAQCLQAGDWRTNVAAAYCARVWIVERALTEFDELLSVAAGEIAAAERAEYVDEHFAADDQSPLLERLVRVCHDDGDEVSASERLLFGIARLTLWPVSALTCVKPHGQTPRWLSSDVPPWKDTLPRLSHGAIERLAELWHVRVADGWKQGATLATPQRQLITQGLELLRKGELLDLAAELRCEVDAQAKRGDLIEAILKQHTSRQPLPLPACFADSKPRRKR